ncbi:MAG: VWA domain-containing protein [Blastocatellia bacterium]
MNKICNHRLFPAIAALISAGLLISALILAPVVSGQQKGQTGPAKPQAPQTPPAQQPAGQKPKQTPDNKTKRDTRQGAEATDDVAGDDKDGAIRIDTEEVQLDVTVVDSVNKPVFDLSQENFSVFEDKVKQDIINVSREEVPISMGLVIDSSGSMRSKLQPVSDSALSLIRQMHTNDEGFLVGFNTESTLHQDFTKDRRDLEDALNELIPSGGTSLLDAIIASADYTNEKGIKSKGEHRRRALVIITDGLEKNSSVKEAQVVEALREVEVQLYLVGFVDEDEKKGLFGKSDAQKARELLTRLAEDSGGRAFFPKDVAEMPAITEQIARDMRTQYVVSYTPSNSMKDGKFRTVKVMIETKDKRKLNARTRQGYYARKDGQAPPSDKKTLSK